MEQQVHSSSEVGAHLHRIRLREDSESPGINRREGLGVFLRHFHPTYRVDQLVSVLDFEGVEGVLALFDFCPYQKRLGVVRMVFPLFRLGAGLALLRLVEIVAAEDVRLDLFEGGH